MRKEEKEEAQLDFLAKSEFLPPGLLLEEGPSKIMS